MGKVVLSGYYGFNNAGDEAVLFSIIQALREVVGSNIRITVLSNEPEHTKKEYGVDSVNRWSIKQIFKEIRSSNLLISGGGSLLQDVTSGRTVVYYLGIVALAKIFKKKVVFYAQGVGPINKWYNKLLTRLIVNKVDSIFVRDEGSRKVLQSLGVNKPKIEVVVDPVVAMELSQQDWEKGKLIVDKIRNDENIPDKPIVGIYLRSWNVSKGFYEELGKIIRYLYEQGWYAVFVPMHHPEDVYEGEKVYPFFEQPCTVLTELYTPKEILSITAQLNLVVAMRLHGLIMAANAGVPFLGLSYDPKINAFVEEVDIGNVFDVKELDSEDVIAYLSNYLKNIDTIRDRLNSIKPEFKVKAQYPANIVKEIL